MVRITSLIVGVAVLVMAVAGASAAEKAGKEKKPKPPKPEIVAGQIAEIDGQNLTLTVTKKTKKPPAEEGGKPEIKVETLTKTVPLADDVRVVINGEPAALADLKVEMKAKVVVKEGQGVKVEVGRKPKPEGEKKEKKLRGEKKEKHEVDAELDVPDL